MADHYVPELDLEEDERVKGAVDDFVRNVLQSLSHDDGQTDDDTTIIEAADEWVNVASQDTILRVLLHYGTPARMKKVEAYVFCGKLHEQFSGHDNALQVYLSSMGNCACSLLQQLVREKLG